MKNLHNVFVANSNSSPGTCSASGDDRMAETPDIGGTNQAFNQPAAHVPPHNAWHHPFTALGRNGERVMLHYDYDFDTEWFQVENGPAIHDAA